jgi:amidase
MADVDLAAVSAAAHRYELALASGDGAAALACFDPAADTSRFGPEGAQLDHDAVTRLRTGSAPTPPATWTHESTRALGPDAVLHLAVLERGGATVQRTQIWRRTDDGWRIVHAHVSSPRSSPEASTMSSTEQDP